MKMHRAKKSLGQNFLKSEIALRQIIDAGEIKSDDVILEIGPGKGALTEKLLERAKLVIAVEKDRELFEMLREKFAEQIKARSFVLVHGDILEFKVESYKVKSYKVIANIPYNITGAILKKFLTEKNQPEMMVLMVQHEVATRILARDGKESILSISVKAYGQPKMVAKVDKRYFSPAPKVNSAIIAIKNISRKNFTPLLVEEGVGGGDSRKNHLALKDTPPQKGGEERFWEIVKTGFAHKRKKLASNLKNICQRDTLTFLGNKRAENLTLADWISLSKEWYN
ncbi:MAG: 16S rRNA (adenine(1518)-N(6)/adenine(1519)-N(6))-dimethyltransferase RsmA [Patescibacteria group bacterium]